MSIEITVQGLNKRQRMLADLLWACDTKADVDRFIAALPNAKLRKEASSIFELITMAAIEQAYDGLGNMDQARDLLQKYNK